MHNNSQSVHFPDTLGSALYTCHLLAIQHDTAPREVLTAHHDFRVEHFFKGGRDLLHAFILYFFYFFEFFFYHFSRLLSAIHIFSVSFLFNFDIFLLSFVAVVLSFLFFYYYLFYYFVFLLLSTTFFV